MFNGDDLVLAQELLEAIQFFNQKGWSPATSTNYSVRSKDFRQYIISRSGVDKSKFNLQDLILIDSEGKVLPPFNRPGIKSSAETEIHTFIYDTFPQAHCVLHTHSVLGTTLSLQYLPEQQILFEGFEILKGLEGNATHDLQEALPIVANSQTMQEITRPIEKQFRELTNIHGFLIAGHGLYTWGKDIATAKRHIETFEFLFECLHTMRRN
jgi:methylthioribulose-1-phosphate dehydratase